MKSIEDIFKYTPENRNPHRLKMLGLDKIYPKKNLLWWGINEGYIWNSDILEEFESKEVLEKVLVEMWKKINKEWDPTPAPDLSDIPRFNASTRRYSIPRYLLDAFFTPTEELELIKNPSLSKEDKEILKNLQKEEDNLFKIVKLVPKHEFQKRIGKLILTTIKWEFANELKVLLSESHITLEPFYVNTEILAEGGTSPLLALLTDLGITYFTRNTLKVLLVGNSSDLSRIIKSQVKSVKRKQAEELCKYIAASITQDGFNEIFRKRKTLHHIKRINELTYASYYLKRKMFSGDVFKDEYLYKNILDTLELIYASPKKRERVIKEALRKKWTSESKLNQLTKNCNTDIIPQLSWFLLQAVKSKKEEPIYDFISFLYELPELLITTKGSIKDDIAKVIEGIWNLEYALKVYPGLRDIEPFIKSEILDAIAVCKFKLKLDNIESSFKYVVGKENDGYVSLEPNIKMLRRINRYIGDDFVISRLSKDLDINSICFEFDSFSGAIFESFDSTLEKGTVFMSEGLKPEYDLGKNPYEDWILGWSGFYSRNIRLSYKTGSKSLIFSGDDTTEEREVFLNGIRDSVRINENNYKFLLFAIHTPTKTVFTGFNPGNTGITMYCDSLGVKIWKPKNFFRYLTPLLNYPCISNYEE